MIKELNKKYLITTNNWFIAPDGQQYRAAFGTVTAIESDSETLGIKTNRGSTNWYVKIGSMIIAGCQIHYCIRTDKVVSDPPVVDLEYNGQYRPQRPSKSLVYDADEGYYEFD